MTIQIIPPDSGLSPFRFLVADNQGEMQAAFVKEQDANDYVDDRTPMGQWCPGPRDALQLDLTEGTGA